MSVSRRALLGGALGGSVTGLVASGALVFGAPEAAYANGLAPTMDEFEAQVVVVGGGLGGVAAALGALRNGASVVLTEATDWIGGQLTSQLVPPDEHRWIEPTLGAYGQTAAYKSLRAAVRQFYKTYFPVTTAFKNDSQPNPGNAWVSRIAADPAVWRMCLWTLLMPYVAGGKLQILLGHRPVAATVSGDRITAVNMAGPDGVTRTVTGQYFVEATETGDLLPLAGAMNVVGREAGGAAGTNELHNTNPTADTEDQQGFTMVLAVGYNRAGGDYRISKPAAYDIHRDAFVKFFSANLFDPTKDYSYDDGPNFWQYRRIAALPSFTAGSFVEEVSLLNYACNDFKTGNLVEVPDTTKQENIAAAKELSSCLLYYLQHEIPRSDGGAGYPALRLRPDVSGTLDGIAKAPYIREARRLVGLGRIAEWHIGVDDRSARLGKPAEECTAADFADTVGTGHYWIDIHPGPKNSGGLWTRCYPYQIPLFAMISRNITNLIAGGKTINTSHVTNGAYRVHPTEWNIGESAGVLAAYCTTARLSPAAVRSTATKLGDYQAKLRAQGVQTTWPAAVRSQWLRPPQT
ncbi:FAD-dependent oxidoreductase [Flindersiella endophytica]